jgi:hypothetical protein
MKKRIIIIFLIAVFFVQYVNAEIFWEVPPTYAYDYIWFCPECDVYFNYQERIIDTQTAAETGEQHWGHGGGGGSMYQFVYDNALGLIGFNGLLCEYLGFFSMEMFSVDDFYIRFPEFVGKAFIVELVDSTRVEVYTTFDGEEIITLSWNAFENNRAVIYEGELVIFGAGIVDIISPTAFIIGSHEGCGIVNEQAETIVPFVFDNFLLIDENRAFANYNGLWGILDLRQTIHGNTNDGDFDSLQEEREPISSPPPPPNQTDIPEEAERGTSSTVIIIAAAIAVIIVAFVFTKRKSANSFIYCKKCGKKLPHDAKFCNGCGTSI